MKLDLSDNEKNVLKLLITDGRIQCTEMARKVGITPQAVGKIQDKLENSGLIKGYSTIVDYRRLGIDVFAVAFFRFKSGSWTRLENEDIKNRVKGPHLLGVYRFSEGDVTHMVVYGFRSLRELDNYFHILQTERGHVSELKKIYVLSSDSVLKDSPNELILKVIDELGNEKLAAPEKPKPLRSRG
ncbi:MAG: winged helix-turn-helix transcriptional regulator [Candidatus Altiarchaeota archaeon]